MSEPLTQREESIKNLLLAGCHLGHKKLTKDMKKYVFKRNRNGVCVFDVDKMYQKIQVAARIIAKVDPEAIIATSHREEGQIATYKFAHFTGASCVSGRWSPGMLTNQITKKFVEPRLIIVTNPSPKIDGKALIESSYVNIPVIAICNSDNDLRYVDCAIPANNRSPKSIAMIWYILTQEVLALTSPSSSEALKNVPPEAFVNMDCIEKKEEKVKVSEEEGEELKEERKEEGGEGSGNMPAKENGEEDEDEGEENFIN